MGVAQGKKVSSDGVAAQTIEAQPVFGQIKPSQRPGASVLRTIGPGEDGERRFAPCKRSKRFGVGKET